MKKLLITILTIVCVMGLVSWVVGEIPHLINYQGRLTDASDTPLPDGSYGIVFRIYDAESAGNLLWQETQSVITKNGIFNVLLGAVTNLDLAFDKPYWLEIKVGNEVMSPRQQIASSGYALRAAVAEDAVHADDAAIADTLSDPTLLVPSGTILMWAGTVVPEGWLLCDGSAVSRTTYSDLFSVISTTYGNGDGAATFNLPDLRGRFPLGKDNMGGSSANRVTATEADSLGQGSGEEKHTLTIAEMPSHTHTYAGTVPQWYGPLGRKSDGNCWPVNTGATGGDAAHNNMPPYITINYIIKL